MDYRRRRHSTPNSDQRHRLAGFLLSSPSQTWEILVTGDKPGLSPGLIRLPMNLLNDLSGKTVVSTTGAAETPKAVSNILEPAGYQKLEYQSQVKQAGGTGRARCKLWELP